MMLLVNMKVKLTFLFVLSFLIQPLYGGIKVEKVMREFQARYHYVCTNFYIWPDCYGGPAPSYPKDGFYGDIEEDPELGVRLVNSLKTAFEGGLYVNFLNSSLEGKTDDDLSYYNITYLWGDFQFPTVTASNYMSVLKQIEDSVYLLKYPNFFLGFEETSIDATSEDPYLRCEGKSGAGSSTNAPTTSCFCSAAADMAINNFTTNIWYTPLDPDNVWIGMTHIIDHFDDSQGESSSCKQLWRILYINSAIDFNHSIKSLIFNHLA